MKTKEELVKSLQRSLATANRVLDGDSEYDGADAAREIRDICEEVIEILA